MKDENFELFLSKLGAFERFQKTSLIIIQGVIITMSMCFFSSVFALQPVDFICVSSQDDENSMSLQNNRTWNTCTMDKPVSQIGNSSEEFDISTGPQTQTTSGSERIPCQDFKVMYSRKDEKTATGDFQLFCDRAHFKGTVTVFLFVGKLVGLSFGGQVGDTLGRKPLIVTFHVIGVIATGFRAFVPNLTLFIVANFFIGLSQAFLYTFLLTMMCEMLEPFHVMVMAYVSEAVYGVGLGILSSVAYFVRDWRKLQLAIAAISLVPSVCFIFFIPESLRWIISRGNFQRAFNQSKKISRINGVTFTDEMKTNLRFLCNKNSANQKTVILKEDFQTENESKLSKFTIVQIFTNKRLTIRVLILAYCWSALSIVYYGISIGGSLIPGNIYINIAIGGFVEVPAMVIAYFASNVFGRKKVFAFASFFTGSCCASITLTTVMKVELGSQILALVGKLGSSLCFGVLCLHAAEILPTCVRTTGFGFIAICARIAAAITPYTLLLSEKVWEPLTFLLFGSVTLIGGLFALFLPETHNKALPDTLEDTAKPDKEKELSDIKYSHIKCNEENGHVDIDQGKEVHLDSVT